LLPLLLQKITCRLVSAYSGENQGGKSDSCHVFFSDLSVRIPKVSGNVYLSATDGLAVAELAVIGPERETSEIRHVLE
jgi:hypothetical protein